MSNYSIKSCIVCSKKYKPKSAAALYCSDCAKRISIEKSKARNVAYRVKKHNSKPLGSTVSCKLCKSVFVKKHNTELYCDDCKKIKHKTQEARKIINANMRRKNKENPVVLAKTRFRNILSQALRRDNYGKKSKANEVLGCTWDEFKLHIERQFVKGMTWENKSKWAIDHIVPLASAKTEEDVIRLNHFTNLRPLWAKDNLAKGAKMEHLI